MPRFPDEDRFATPAEAVAEWARHYGAEHPEKAWLLHDFDVWVANPAYAGPPVPHPEYDEPWDTDGDTSKWNENGESSEAENDRYANRSFDDPDIPF